MSERLEARYPAVLEPQANGALLVRFVDLEDTFTEGATPDEALFNGAEVLSAMLGCRLDHGLPIPDPSPAGDGLYLIAPDARTQAALLIRRAHGRAVLGGTGPLAGHLLALGPALGKPVPFVHLAGGLGQTSSAGLGMTARTLQRR